MQAMESQQQFGCQTKTLRLTPGTLLCGEKSSRAVDLVVDTCTRKVGMTEEEAPTIDTHYRHLMSINIQIPIWIPIQIPI